STAPCDRDADAGPVDGRGDSPAADQRRPASRGKPEGVAVQGRDAAAALRRFDIALQRRPIEPAEIGRSGYVTHPAEYPRRSRTSARRSLDSNKPGEDPCSLSLRLGRF